MVYHLSCEYITLLDAFPETILFLLCPENDGMIDVRILSLLILVNNETKSVSKTNDKRKK